MELGENGEAVGLDFLWRYAGMRWYIAALLLVAFAVAVVGLARPGVGSASGSAPEPPILAAQVNNNLTGMACAGCVVDVFVGEDMTYLASGVADGDGSFSIALPCGLPAGSLVATAAHANGKTSGLSAPLAISATSPCPSPTPTPGAPSPSPTPVPGTATNTPRPPTATPRPTDPPRPTNTRTPVRPTSTSIPTDTPETPSDEPPFPSATPTAPFVSGPTPVPTVQPTEGPSPSPTATAAPGPLPNSESRLVDVSIDPELNSEQGPIIIVSVFKEELTVTRPGSHVPTEPEVGDDGTWDIYFGEYGRTELELQVSSADFDVVNYSPEQTQPILRHTEKVEWRVPLRPRGDLKDEHRANVTIVQHPPNGEDLPAGVERTYNRLLEFTFEGEGGSRFNATMTILMWALPGGVLPLLAGIGGFLNRQRILEWLRARLGR